MRVLFIMKPYVIDPLGVAYLSTALKKRGHEVDLVTLPEVLDEKVYELIYESKPDVLAYSVQTGSQNFFLKVNSVLKNSFDIVVRRMNSRRCVILHKERLKQPNIP